VNTCILKGYGLPQGSGPLFLFVKDPATLSFAAKVGTDAVQTVVVQNVGDQAGAPSIILTNTKFSVTSGVIGTLQPLGTAVVSIQCDASLAGSFNAQASFAAYGDNYLDLLSQVTAAGAHYTISPGTWTFGSLAFNSGKQTKQFSVQNTGDAAGTPVFVISQAQPWFSIESAPGAWP
jgi:hypothetical protein